MFDSIFELFYFLGLIAASIIRVVYTKSYNRKKIRADHKTVIDAFLISLPGIGMFILPILYIFTIWLDFANYQLPSWTGWIGVVLFAIMLWLLWRSHADLGLNWSPALQIMEEHSLITHGIYHHIRHPMYTAHVVWAVAQPFLIQNWIAGIGMLVCIFPGLLYRIPREEQMMHAQFGEDYREYIESTGSILPRLSRLMIRK